MSRRETIYTSAVTNKDKVIFTTPTPPPQQEKPRLAPVYEEAYPYYGQPREAEYYAREVEYYAQVNVAGHRNQGGNWPQWKNKDTPWQDHPNFRWSDQPPPPAMNPPNQQEGQPNWSNNQPDGRNFQPYWSSKQNEGPISQSNWSGKNQEGPNNWNNQGQRNKNNWSGKNQGNNYVPPHQRGYQGNQANSQQGYQHRNQVQQGNYQQG